MLYIRTMATIQGVHETILPVVLDMPVPLTDDLIASLGSLNPQYRFETTADGRLILTPGTGFFASGGEAELIRQVGNWNKEHGLGHVSSSSGYFKQLDAAVKGPDCTYTTWESIDAQIPLDRKPQAYEQLAPDVTFELTSPTDGFTTLDTKCRGYATNGNKAVLLLISRTQSVATYRPNAEPVYADDIAAVVIGSEMPGFVLDAQAVFAASIRKRPNT